MASPQAFEPIEEFLRDVWTASPIGFENERYPLAKEPAAFVYVEVFGSLYAQASIGDDPQEDNLWRENGVLQLHVLVPRGTGSRLARTHAKALADLFKGRELAGIRFRDASIGVGEPGENDGNYWRMSVTIEFERDE